MSEERRIEEETTEVVEEINYVTTKEAFASIGHNIKVTLTDKEAWKRRGVKILKGLGVAGAVAGGLILAEKMLLGQNNEDDEDEFEDDDIVDTDDFTITDVEEETTNDETETNE